MKRISLLTLAALATIFLSGCFGMCGYLIAADVEYDHQIIMNVPPTDPLHVATKQYVDENGGGGGGGDAYLPITGGTMQGPIYLYRDPLGSLEPATKQYVDTAVAGAGGAAFPSLASSVDIPLTSGSTWTATGNGWIQVRGTTTGASAWGLISAGQIEIARSSPASGIPLADYLPVKAGAVVTIAYGDMDITDFKFIPAE